MDKSTFTKKTGDFSLPKALPQFYLENFVATLVDKPTVPATDFESGKPIRFQWESNGTHYQLFEKNQSKPVYEGPGKAYTLTDGTSRDTTFILRASTNTAGQGQPQDSKFLYSTLTVTVSNPDLTPSSVTASGNVAVGGTLNVTGVATMNGGLVAKESAVSMMTGMKVMEPGSYKALTDGFVLGMVDTPSSDEPCQALIMGHSFDDGVQVFAAGGMFIESVSASFLLPVRKTVSWTISVLKKKNNPIITFWWIPIGTAPNGQSSPLASKSLPIEVELTATNNPSTFTSEQHLFPLPKISSQLYLENFVATLPDTTPTVPATDFESGKPICFQWESNGTHYQLFEKDQSQPVYEGPDKTYTLPNGTSRDTTFILCASTNTADQGQPQDSKILYDALTITVPNPALDSVKSVKTTGNVTVEEMLNVTGVAIMNGKLVATQSAVSMMTGAHVIPPGSHTALTDGFVLGTVQGPALNANDDCWCWISGESSGLKVESFCGGRFSGSIMGYYFTLPGPGSFLLPVQQKATYAISVKQSPDNPHDAITKFWWIPIGKG